MLLFICRMISGSGGSGGRLGQMCQNLPVVSRVILGVCFIVYFYTPMLYPYESLYFDMNPYRIVFKNEYYRLLTGCYLHGGIFHIAMNMLTFFSIGVGIEQSIGSLSFFGLTILFSLLSTSLETFGRYIIFKVTNDIDWLRVRSVGFSGVLFSYIIIHTYVTGAQNYNLCGFPIPARYYPWVLLIGISLLIRNVSFAGHLCGLLVGIMYCRGYLNFILPRRGCLRSFENWEGFEWLTNSLIYAKCPVDSPIPATDAWGGWSCEMCSESIRFIGGYCMSISDSIRSICATAGQGISSAMMTQRRSPSAYQQLSAEDDLELVQDENGGGGGVPPSAPAFTEEEEEDGTLRNDGYTLGVREHHHQQHVSQQQQQQQQQGVLAGASSAINSKEQKKKKKTAGTNSQQYSSSRATPSGRSRLLDTIPRKKNNTTNRSSSKRGSR
eukprot:jgi/Bigna1/91013/estExt_fgenesh1_pg.C_850095